MSAIDNILNEENCPFPWALGVFDAHCHPTDTMTSIAAIPHMKASALTIMATRGEDQHLVEQVASKLGGRRIKQQNNDEHQRIHSDSSSSSSSCPQVIPCFGWHPWFAHQIRDDISSPASALSTSSPTFKIEHYRKVLTGPASFDDDDETFFTTLPEPKPLSSLLAETRARLITHPDALVGEVGLDKAFRLPKPWEPQDIECRDPSLTPGSREGRTLSPYRVVMSHQKALLKAQLQLAGELRRPVSVHSVQAHGAVFEVLQELWRGHERKIASRRERRRRYSVEGAHQASDVDEEEAEQKRGNKERNDQLQEKKEEQEKTGKSPLPFPPRICMHSYSGPAQPLTQFLRPTVPSDVYFSFSTVINFSGRSVDKVVEVIRCVPDDRILIESDLHTAGQQIDDLLEEVVRTVCKLRGWTLERGVKQLADNWKRFVFG
jgi:Tat protein secretion system quality control protein TatD with DNase activity